MGRRARIGGLLLGATIGVVVARRMRQRQRETTVLDAISGPVSIRWSRRGVPRIAASSRDDALFGLGYAMAHDRPWQLDLNRRAALGRLAEVAGPSMLHEDRLMRLIDMPRIAKQLVSRLDPDTRRAIEAFTAGINHRFDTAPLPLGMRLAGERPDPWQAVDSLAIMRLLGWSLSGSFATEITAEQLREVLDDDWVDVIYLNSYPERPPMIRRSTERMQRAPEPVEHLPLSFDGAGSNGWAVDGQHSATGAPLLANDPHLELRNPSLWYEVSLEAPGFQVAGATMAGIPTVLIGRTLDLAWGATATMTPQVFLYREQVDEQAQRVRDGGQWQPLSIRHETIHVRGADPEILAVRETPRGPLLSDLEPGPQPFSLYWTGMEPSSELKAMLAVNAGGTIPSARDAMSEFATPPLNILAADRDGSIAMLSVGRLPARESRVGYLDPDQFPPRYLATEDQPAEINPERGWVAAANNRMLPDDDPRSLYGHWAPGFRYRRIAEELESRPRHSPAEMRQLQLDITSVHARDVLPALLALIDGHAPTWLIDDLRAWDFTTPPESRATLLFETVHREWTRLALAHRLPDALVERLMRRGGTAAVPLLFVDRLLAGELTEWWEGDPTQLRSELASQAVEQALNWIAEQLGDDREEWTWGALHTLMLSHPLATIPGPQRRRLQLGPFPVGGTRYTVAPQFWRGPANFHSDAGPSLRYVADLRRPGEDWFVIPPGQSESPLSRHYRDQLHDYLQGFAHHLWPAAKSEGQRRITLQPSEPMNARATGDEADPDL